MIEIGCGPGILTEQLLASGCKLVCCDLDPEHVTNMRERLRGTDARIIHADGAKLDYSALLREDGERDRLRLVGNLPYSASSAIVANAIEQHRHIDDITIMVQREVGHRLLASPGEPAWGRLGLLTSGVCSNRRLVCNIPAQAFSPPPQVVSSLIQLSLGTPADWFLTPGWDRIARIALQQRRRKLRHALKHLGGAELCERAGVDADQAVQDCGGETFAALASAAARKDTSA